MHYFESYYKGVVKSPQIKLLTRIWIKPVPQASSMKSCCDIYYVILREFGLDSEKIFDNKGYKDQQRFVTKLEGEIDLPLHEPQILFGNIMIKFFTKGTLLNNSELFRVTFNTAFIGFKN